MSSDSRLEKLLKLLASKNPVIRRQAAQSIGEVQRTRPEGAGGLLLKLYEYLKKNSWETRTAAAEACGFVFRALPDVDEESNSADVDVKPERWAPFNVEQILRTKRPLLGSNGKSFDRDSDEPVLIDRKLQRQQVDIHLSLEPQVGLDSREWITDEDILPIAANAGSSPKLEWLEEDEASDEPPPCKAPRLNGEIGGGAPTTTTTTTSMTTINPLDVLRQGEPDDALSAFCTLLLSDMANANWEMRHGAALGLKQMMLAAARRLSAYDRARAARRILQVLTLDRFNDFVGATAVAPVRETCAQTLSALVVACDVSGRSALFNDVIQLLQRSDVWECRQSGLLVVKYVLPAFPDTTDIFLTFIVTLLADENDEVSSAAAQALVPLCGRSDGMRLFESLIAPVWLLLQRAASIEQVGVDATVLSLLNLVHSWLNQATSVVQLNESQYSALLSLLDFSSADVRQAAIECVAAAVLRSDASALSDSAVERTIRSLYRRVLFEPPDSPVVLYAVAGACAVIDRLAERAVDLVCPLVGAWLACLMVGDDAPTIDVHLCSVSRPETQTKTDEPLRLHIAGAEICALSESARASVVFRRKIAAARVLARLFNQIGQCHHPRIDQQTPAESLELLLCLHINSPSLYQRSAVALVLHEWGKIVDKSKTLPTQLLNDVAMALASPLAVYEETTLRLSQLSCTCTEFIAFCQKLGAQTGQSTAVTSPSQAETLCRTMYEAAKAIAKGQRLSELEERWTALSKAITHAAPELQDATTRLNGLLAAALARWAAFPDKLNPVIKPLMDSVKTDADDHLAVDIAAAVARMLLLAESRVPCPNAKLIKNLATLLYADGRLAPKMADFEEGNSEKTAMIAMNSDASIPIGSKSRNAALALQQVCALYGELLPSRCPALAAYLHCPADANNQETINTLSVWCAVLGYTVGWQNFVDEQSQGHLLEMLSSVNAAVRNSACRFLLEAGRYRLADTLNAFLPTVLASINDLQQPARRAGAIELLLLWSRELDAGLVGAATLLAPSALGRMTDPDPTIREASSIAFSLLVRLMPLEQAAGSALVGLNAQLTQLLEKNRKFLTLLTDPSHLPTVDPSQLEGLSNVELRSYQRDGVTWMWFLNQYRLHGVLSDDMGLGKTLQTLCVLAASYKNSASANKSLIVCPRTLVAHWLAEIDKYFDATKSSLKPVAVESAGGFAKIGSATVVVTSYETLRKEAAQFSGVLWHYCILDEGHIVRNPKTQLFKAVMGITAEHRLLLSGTPVQNSVQELWTLFHFLMPGYLGTQQDFNAKYTRPIAQSRDAKANSTEAEAGTRALDTLHKLILPFIMRRLKSEVLKELPPKIVQDYYCELTSVQTELYTAFSESVIKGSLASGAKSDVTSPFKILNYLRKLIDHPCMVLNDRLPRS
uniref:Helicase ATP-binding domain-containing protein n=1 Tax=Plectus sambesii TaxID=2011161 RepID=A0A914W6E8_9BILA